MIRQIKNKKVTLSESNHLLTTFVIPTPMQAEDKDREHISKAINGLATAVTILLGVVGALTIYIVYFTQPIPNENIWPPDSGGVPSQSINTSKDSVADTTAVK